MLLLGLYLTIYQCQQEQEQVAEVLVVDQPNNIYKI
jgi:predicted XRE-type DNA-binding protein